MSTFYIVGPTAVGKSKIAADVAQRCGAEIVNADAFQIYAGLDLLTGKPDAATLRKVLHHLLGTTPLSEPMDAGKFRSAALRAIAEIQARSAHAIVAGGSGMYVQALTHGLSQLPPANAELRAHLEHHSESELLVRLEALDPATARAIDTRNKRRLIRAVEICLLSERPVSALRQRAAPACGPRGVFLFRDRDDLQERINHRVEMMFAEGVVEEVRALENISPTAAQTLGLSQIWDLLAGKTSPAQCIAAIQQATRRYAKRQLTWFRGQTNFAPLNLSRTGSSAAVDSIARQARLAFALTND